MIDNRDEEDKEPKTLDETLSSYFEDDFGRSDITESTRQTYKSHLRSFRNWAHGCDCNWTRTGGTSASVDDCTCEYEYGKLMLRDVEADHVEDWVREMKIEGYGTQTVQKAYYSTMTFLRSRHPEITSDDVVDLEKAGVISEWGKTTKELADKEEITYLEPEQVRALWENVPSPSFKNEVIIRLMWQTGLRQSDAVDIEVGDVNYDDGERHIKIVDRKNKIPDKVWFAPSFRPVLRRWIEQERDALSPIAEDSPYLFYGDRSEQMKPADINDMVKEAAENAGIQEPSYVDAGGGERKKITGHILRHSFAADFVKSGGDIRWLQDLLRHSNIETTRKYLKLRDEDVREARDKYGPQ